MAKPKSGNNPFRPGRRRLARWLGNASIRTKMLLPGTTVILLVALASMLAFSLSVRSFNEWLYESTADVTSLFTLIVDDEVKMTNDSMYDFIANTGTQSLLSEYYTNRESYRGLYILESTQRALDDYQQKTVLKRHPHLRG